MGFPWPSLYWLGLKGLLSLVLDDRQRWKVNGIITLTLSTQKFCGLLGSNFQT